MARKEKIYHYIYKTTNLLNGKYYYGMHSTNNLEDGYLGSGKRLRYSVNKHGKENHSVEILEFLPDRKELVKREKEIVNLNEIAKENCMNIMTGGEGGLPTNINLELFHYLGGKAGGNIHAQKLKNDPEFAEAFKLISSNRMKKLHLDGKSHSWKGKHHSIETKELMRKSHDGTGKKNSQYGTCWITNGFENKKVKKEELHLLSNGWKLGRKQKH